MVLNRLHFIYIYILIYFLLFEAGLKHNAGKWFYLLDPLVNIDILSIKCYLNSLKSHHKCLIKPIFKETLHVARAVK